MGWLWSLPWDWDRGVAAPSSPEGASGPGGSPWGRFEGYRPWEPPDLCDHTSMSQTPRCVLRTPVRARPDVATEVRGADVTWLRSRGAPGGQDGCLGESLERWRCPKTPGPPFKGRLAGSHRDHLGGSRGLGPE